MKNEIEAMITDITATTSEAEDYTGEDGLLYCGKCHTPKEAYFPKETAQRLQYTKIEKGSVLSTLITYRREAKPWQRKKKSKSQLYTSDYPETMNRLANRTPS